MPAWRPLRESEWISPGYLADHDSWRPDRALRYEEHAFASGDFDGDGRIDHALYLIGPAEAGARVSWEGLWVFHTRERGYEAHQVDPSGEEHLGSVLGTDTRRGEFRPPFDENPSPILLEHDSLAVINPEKSSKLCHFDGGRYRCFFTSD